jgi:hypothetical protein
MPGLPSLGSLTRNGGLKLAAFGLALFLWVLVRVGAPGERDLLVPIDIRLADPSWILLGDPVPATVLVRFRGPPTEIFRLSGLDGMSLAVPIAEVLDQEMTIPLQPGWVPLDGYRGVQVEDIVPSAISVQLDRMATRTIPVRVSARGRLPDHLALTRPLSLTPNLVRVSGPASLVEQLDTLDVVPVDLSEIEEQATVETVVDTVGMGQMAVVPNVVTVRIPAEESIERLITGVRVVADPVFGRGLIEVLPESIQIRVRGARSRVSAMEAEFLRAVVPSDAMENLGEVERRRVPIEVEGVPSFVTWVPGADSVVVRRWSEL